MPSRRRSRTLQHGAFFFYRLVGDAGAVRDGESGGLPALSWGTAGPPGGFVPVPLKLPAALPVVVSFGIPVFGPAVVAPVFDDVDTPGFESPPPV